MKKADVKALEQLSKNLPPQVHICPCTYTYTGEELMLGGYKDLNPKELYELDGYQIVHVNHKERLKEEFKKKRVEGVRKYTKEVTAKYFNNGSPTR